MKFKARIKSIFLFLLILLNVCILHAQIEVSGVVLDEKEQPLPGATVTIKGTTTGTVTNLGGEFNLGIVSSESVLSVSYVGYETQELVIANKVRLYIVLNPSFESIDEVVVIGYGTQKKSDLTGAVGSVSGEDLNKIAAADVNQALQGQAAGVMVIQNSGAPGSPNTVRIRGIGSFGNATPLYVVDGVPVSDIGYLNQADIESIEVLKDASSAAIYGTRAANGVVLIQTKSGSHGKTSINFSGYYGFQQLGNKFEVLDADDLIEYNIKAFTNEGEAFALLSPFNDYEKQADTDWVDEITRIAPVQNYHLSLQGGNENLNYSFSSGYYKQEGIVIGSEIQKVTTRFNLQAKINEKMKFSAGISYANTRSESIDDASEFGPISLALKMDPTVPVYDNLPDFKYYGTENYKTFNPVARIEYQTDEDKKNALLANVNYEWEILPTLVFRSQYGLDFSNRSDMLFRHEYHTRSDDEFSPADLTKAYGIDMDHAWENTLTFHKKINDHNLTFLTGSSVYYYTSEYANVFATEFYSNSADFRHLSSSLNSSKSASGSYQIETQASVLGRLIYSYQNKYLLTASIRRDGSSKFGENKRWGTFPSFNLGWKISEESFMKTQDLISFLKLRGGWGIIGNNQIGLYRYATLIENDQALWYTFGVNQVEYPGMAPLSAGNGNLQWEESEQTNIGLDAAFLRNRVLFTMDVYRKSTNNQLLELPTLAVGGLIEAPTVNAGNIINKGIEAELTWRKKEGLLNYEIAGNITYNQNNVESFDGAGGSKPSGDVQSVGLVNRTTVGYPIASFYGYLTNGIFQTWEEVNNHALQSSKTRPGDIRFVDLNQDGVINDNDQTFLGSPVPDLIYGMRFNIDYKGIIDFSAFFQGVFGNQLYNGLRVQTSGLSYNMNTEVINSWSEENPTNDVRFPRLTFMDQNSNARNSDRWIEEGSYIRLKNIQMGYSLPEAFLNRFKISRVRIYVSAQNLLTFTKYSGFDPEIGSSNKSFNVDQSLDLGIDRGNYPVPKIIRFGIDMSL